MRSFGMLIQVMLQTLNQRIRVISVSSMLKQDQLVILMLIIDSFHNSFQQKILWEMELEFHHWDITEKNFNGINFQKCKQLILTQYQLRVKVECLSGVIYSLLLIEIQERYNMPKMELFSLNIQMMTTKLDKTGFKSCLHFKKKQLLSEDQISKKCLKRLVIVLKLSIQLLNINLIRSLN